MRTAFIKTRHQPGSPSVISADISWPFAPDEVNKLQDGEFGPAPKSVEHAQLLAAEKANDVGGVMLLQLKHDPTIMVAAWDQSVIEKNTASIPVAPRPELAPGINLTTTEMAVAQMLVNISVEDILFLSRYRTPS